MRSNDRFFQPDTSARDERLARIRAKRGTPEREAAINTIAAARAKQHELARLLEVEEREWTRRFDRADLRTQALMLAQQFESTDATLARNLTDLAKNMPAGLR